MKVSILDDANSRPELVGDVVIPLKDAFDAPPTEGYDKWHELKFKGKYVGEVYLEMTFYSTQPRKYKKPASLSDSSSANSIYSAVDFNASCASSIMGSSISSRPLPNSPIKSSLEGSMANLRNGLSNMRVSPHKPSQQHIFAASVSNLSLASSSDHAQLPTSHSVPAISDLVSSISPRVPPHRNSLYELNNGRSMSSTSLSYTDAQIADEIDMPAIPPEPPLHHSVSSASIHTMDTVIHRPVPTMASAPKISTAKAESEFDAFFNSSIDAMHPEHPANRFEHNYSENAGTAPERTDLVRSPLSESTSSGKSVETIQPPSPLTPQSEMFSPDERKSPVKRKPVDSLPSNQYNSSSPVLPYPGATYSTDPSAPSLGDEDEKAYRNVPFSADSYLSAKPELSKRTLPPSPPVELSNGSHPDKDDGVFESSAMQLNDMRSSQQQQSSQFMATSGQHKSSAKTVSHEYQMGNGKFTRTGLRQPPPYLSNIRSRSSVTQPPPPPPTHSQATAGSLNSSATHRTSLSHSASILSGPREPIFSSTKEQPYSEPEFHNDPGYHDEDYQNFNQGYNEHYNQDYNQDYHHDEYNNGYNNNVDHFYGSPSTHNYGTNLNSWN